MIELSSMMTIPKAERRTTGPEEGAEIELMKEDFFYSVRRALGATAVQFDGSFKRVNSELKTDGLVDSDNWLSVLTFCDMQVLATVLDWRDQSNFHIVSFAAYDVLDPCEKMINEAKKIILSQQNRG